MAEPLSLIGLAPDDIARLPARLRKRIGASSRSPDAASGVWLLVGEATGEFAPLIAHAVETFPLLAAERRSRLTEANVDKILDVILSDMPRAPVDTALEVDNATLRAEYLRETPLLTAADVRDVSGLCPRNKSEPASRWKREGKLFAVRSRGIDLYPAFQFADGVPRPAIKEILAALPNGMTGWQTAMWFASGNGWLDGAEPQDCLSDAAPVIDAAGKLADPAIG